MRPANRVILFGLERRPDNPILALAIAAFVVTACGQIVGLHDPDEAVPGGGTVPGENAPTAADDVEITPAAIDVGAVTCGGGAPATSPPPIVIKNRGTTTPHYTVQLPAGSGFELEGPLEGDLAPGATVTVIVKAKPNSPGEN